MAPASLRPRVLIADDSPTHRLSVERELADLDVEIAHATTGIHTLKMVSVFRPDLVTLDIEMPDLNGYRVLDQLRAQERTMSVPVIMISGKPDDAERVRALEGGAVAYFSKPFPEGQLRSLVKRLLERLSSNRTTTIFCVDGDEAVQKQIGRRLQTHGYQFRAFGNTEELAGALETTKCELVLLDLQLPDQAAYQVLDRLNAQREEGGASVLGLATSQTRGDLLHAFQLGIEDFVRKPFFGEELLARVDHLLTVRRRHAQLQKLAVIDPLTGLPNRADLYRRLPAELSRALRIKHNVGVMMLDIDHFKSLNDTYGHPFGDQVLREVARAMQSGLRASDLLARYGGEEFMLLVPNANHAGLLVVAERLRKSVEALELACEDKPVKVTISLGACIWDIASLRHDQLLPELVKPADVALYRAKQSGRNRVCFASSENAKDKPK